MEEEEEMEEEKEGGEMQFTSLWHNLQFFIWCNESDVCDASCFKTFPFI